MSDHHPRVQIVVDALVAHGASGQVRILPDSARTAREAADALGAPVGAIVKSMVFDAGGMALLVLTAGDHDVDVAKAGVASDLADLCRATPEFVRAHTGQAIGGVAPVGHPTPVRTLVDRTLARYDVVWAAAGHPHAVFPSTFDELVAITSGTPADVA